MLRTLISLALLLTFALDAHAQLCRSVSVRSYAPSYAVGSYYAPSYSYAYPSYSYYAVPVAVVAEIYPASYYSVDAGYGAKLVVDAKGKAAVDLENAQSANRRAEQDKFLESLAKVGALDAAKLAPFLSIIKQQQAPPVLPPPAPNPSPSPGPAPKQADVGPPSVQGNLATIQSIAAAKCMTCHNAQKQDGKLDLTDVAKLSPAQWGEMWKRTSIEAPDYTMPLGRPRLTSEELSAIAQRQILMVASK